MRKQNVLLLATLFSIGTASAQSDFSGAYGYSSKAPAEAPKTEANRGPAATLVLVKMEGNKYRFWLDLTTGWPNYAVGETDGTINFTNDTATFDNTFESAVNPCILHFEYVNNSIRIKSHSASFNCGFGNGVNADGDYPKLKVQPVLNNEWLRKEYGQAPVMIISDDNTELYRDESLQRSFSPKRYFKKGDRIFAIAATQSAIYTEFFNANGFNYGWIRKDDIKTLKEQ